MDRSAILLLNDDASLEVRAKVNKLIADKFPNGDLLPLQSQYYDKGKENSKDKLKETFAKTK